jgi:glycerol-3-phosphate acyltransferase PlsY
MSTRSVLLPLVVLSGFVVIVLPVRIGFTTWTTVLSGSALLLFLFTIYLTRRNHVFTVDKSIEIKKWRILARPFAILFIPVRTVAGQKFLIYLLGVLAIIFIVADLYRIFTKRSISYIFKKSEFQRFSSMTSFLVAVFIIFLLFPPEVAYLCLTFIIFGDVAAKMAGYSFGRTKIIHDKTLEGSMGFLTGCLFTGFILCSVFDFQFEYLMIGALCATVTELFSHRIDDNFTVGIITGVCLQALSYFQVL